MSSVEPKQSTRDLADVLKKSMTLNDQGIVEIPADTYEQTLEGTGITIDNVKAVQKHNANVFAASALAVGEVGIAAMKKDKKLDQISIEIPVVKDAISHVFQRSKEVMAGLPKAGEETPMQTSWGVMRSTFTSDVTGSKGEAKKVRKYISQLAEEALAKK